MSQSFTCPNGATVNPDGTLSCDQWVLVELPAPDPIHQMTPEQLDSITGYIVLSFAVAWVFRFAIRYLLDWSGFGRNSG